MGLLFQSDDGVIISVKVQPNASQAEVVGRHGDHIKVLIAAPAEGGKANAALCSLFAEVLNVKRRDVVVVSGATGRIKLIKVRNCTGHEVLCRLDASGVDLSVD